MDEQDFRRISEVSYLNTENTWRYRSILHFCFKRHEHMSRDNLAYKLAKLIGKYCMDIYLLSMFVLVPLRIVFVNLGVMNYVNYYLYVMFSVVLGVVIPWAVSNYVVRKNKVLSALLIGG